MLIATFCAAARSVAAPSADNAMAAPAFVLGDLSRWSADSASAALVASPRSPNGKALQIDFQPADYPNVSVSPDNPVDLTNKSLLITVTNPGAKPVD